MKGYEYPEFVLKGIEYLDARYPRWWLAVSAKDLDIYSVRWHPLAQVHSQLLYEVPEIIHWSNDQLVAHGFIAKNGLDFCGPLTAEWQFQIRRIWKERA